MPKKTSSRSAALKKQKNQVREQQILSFAATPAGSVIIAAGVAVVALPHAMRYLISAMETQGLPYVTMLPERIGQAIADHAKATRKEIEEEKEKDWHESNPDVTTEDIDIPARTGDPYTDYLNFVGLPLSSVLLVVNDWTALAAYHRVVGGDWKYYGRRVINNQSYWLLVPKNINVFWKKTVVIDTQEPDEYGLCNVGYEITTKDAQGFDLPSGVKHCQKTIIEQIPLQQKPWPSPTAFHAGWMGL